LDKQKFVVVDVYERTPKEIEELMNELDASGYKILFQSDIHWYQGKGDCGIITFELREE
jgi:hypothetical protein